MQNPAWLPGVDGGQSKEDDAGSKFHFLAEHEISEVSIKSQDDPVFQSSPVENLEILQARLIEKRDYIVPGGGYHTDTSQRKVLVGEEAQVL